MGKIDWKIYLGVKAIAILIFIAICLCIMFVRWEVYSVLIDISNALNTNDKRRVGLFMAIIIEAGSQFFSRVDL